MAEVQESKEQAAEGAAFKAGENEFAQLADETSEAPVSDEQAPDAETPEAVFGKMDTHQFIITGKDREGNVTRELVNGSGLTKEQAQRNVLNRYAKEHGDRTAQADPYVRGVDKYDSHKWVQ